MHAQKRNNVATLFSESVALSEVTVFYFGFRVAQLPATDINEKSITLEGQIVVPSANSYLEIQFEIAIGDAGETIRLPVYLGQTNATLTELFFSDIEEPGLARIRDHLNQKAFCGA